MDRTLDKSTNDLIGKIEERNNGKVLLDLFAENAPERKQAGRRKKNTVIPESEIEVRYTFICNKYKLNRLQEIAYNERFQMKEILGGLIDLFINEYDRQNNK